MPGEVGSNKLWRERIKRHIIGVPIFLGIYLGLILFYIYPYWPADLIGWFILFLAGIPISLCLELIGESILSKKSGLKISDEKISVKRIALSLFVFVAIAGILTLLWFVFGPFIRQHFV